MVKYSLQSLLDKFPYFLNKDKSSNFYKVQWVNNENFKTLYNDLYQVYESFHLTKRLLVWKEQDCPYDYKINFVANYPNLKSVKITKNDELIYRETYTEEESKDSFNFTYICEYVLANLPRVNVYKCNNCNNIYFTTSELDTCSECQHELIKTNIYKCENCGEIYFATHNPGTCTDCSGSDLTRVQAYRCSHCGQIYFSTELPEECPNCGVIGSVKPTTDIYYNDPAVTIIDNSMDFSEENYVDEDSNIITGYPEYIPPETENESFEEESEEIEELVKDEFLIPIPIILNDQFIITVETYDEYTFEKGFPENDITYDEYNASDKKYDVFNHDYSLDEFGILNNIPRKEYIDVNNKYLYNLTEPPYNDRLTEDDYHYMNRILEYNIRLYAKLRLNELKDYDSYSIKYLYHTYQDYYSKIGIKTFKDFQYYVDNPHRFEQDYNPITLEIWKLYGLPSTLLNRERLLLKMFDETKHDFDEENGLVECWQPLEWEHKDRFCDGSTSLGEYFIVEADNIRPVIYQNVKVTFKLLNSLAEEITDDYVVDIYYYLAGETCPDTPIRADYSESTAVISYKLFEDNIDKTHVLRFVAHRPDSDEIIGSEEILFNVRNCDDGDWYVSEEDGDDVAGDGSEDKPFRTLKRALDVVSNALDLIVIKGNITLNDESSIPVVNSNCTIMGCDEESSITSNYQREFLHLAGSRNITVHLVNLNLQNDELFTKIKIIDFTNNNRKFQDYETVLIHGGAPVLIATVNDNVFYPYDNINFKGLLTNKEEKGLKNKNLTVSIGERNISTITTSSDDGHYGEFDEWVHINQTYTTDPQKLYLKFIHNDYFDNILEWDFTYKEPVQINVKINQTIQLTSTGHEPNSEVGFYHADENFSDDVLIDTVTSDSEGNATLTWIPPWGSYIVYTFSENEGEAIHSEWLLETTMKISDLPTTEFINSISFESNGDFKYNTKTVSKIRDLEGLMIGLDVNPDLTYTETYFSFPSDYDTSRLDSAELTPEEYEYFKQALTDITVNDDGDLILHRPDI